MNSSRPATRCAIRYSCFFSFALRAAFSFSREATCSEEALEPLASSCSLRRFSFISRNVVRNSVSRARTASWVALKAPPFSRAAMRVSKSCYFFFGDTQIAMDHSQCKFQQNPTLSAIAKQPNSYAKRRKSSQKNKLINDIARIRSVRYMHCMSNDLSRQRNDIATRNPFAFTLRPKTNVRGGMHMSSTSHLSRTRTKLANTA